MPSGKEPGREWLRESARQAGGENVQLVVLGSFKCSKLHLKPNLDSATFYLIALGKLLNLFSLLIPLSKKRLHVIMRV